MEMALEAARSVRGGHLANPWVGAVVVRDGVVISTGSTEPPGGPHAELAIRYARSARYDDLIRIRTWVREAASRRVTFGYAIELAEPGTLLATARTSMMVLNAGMEPARLPAHVADLLTVTPDPVRLGL